MLRQVIGTAAALAMFWFAWRSLQTGMPAGNEKMNPRRSERLGQFWFVFSIYVGLGVFYGAHAWGLI